MIDRTAWRPLILSGVLLMLLGAGMLLASGTLKTVLFLLFIGGGITLSATVWPEFLVIAYMFAGRYEYDPRLAPFDLPVSVNQLMLVGIVGVGLMNAKHLGRAIRSWSIVTLLLFSCALVLGLGWSYGLNYGVYKVTRTWGLIVPGVLVAATILERRRSVLPLIAAVFAVGFGLNTLALLDFEQSMGGNRMSALGSGPITFARAVGASLLIALLTVVWKVQQRSKAPRDRLMLLGALVATAFLLPGFVLAQSRGPALSLFAALAVVFTLSLYGSWRVVVTGLFVGAISIRAGAWILDTTLGHTRFDLTKKTNQAGLDGRVGHLTDSWEVIVQHPFLGVGTGGWPVSVYGIDSRAYPHNFFVEIAAENGVPLALLLAALFLTIIGRGFVAWLRAGDPRLRFILTGAIAAWLFFMINVSATGDSVDNRLIWVSLITVEMSGRLARASARSYVRARPRRAAVRAVPLPSSPAT